MLDLKSHFSRFLSSDPLRLHFAAHSHHPWPDVSRAAHQRAWDDAARLIDGKWEHILGHVLPEAQRHIARQLNLKDPAGIVFAPNTHELLLRLLSCCPAGRPVRVLTSDSEFHSFTRQIARLEEDGLVQVQRVAARIEGAKVATLRPDLVVSNAYCEGASLTYEFELYADADLTLPVSVVRNVGEGAARTSP